MIGIVDIDIVIFTNNLKGLELGLSIIEVRILVGSHECGVRFYSFEVSNYYQCGAVREVSSMVSSSNSFD